MRSWRPRYVRLEWVGGRIYLFYYMYIETRADECL